MGILHGERCDYSDCREMAVWRLGYIYAARPMCDTHAKQAKERDQRLMMKPLLQVVAKKSPDANNE